LTHVEIYLGDEWEETDKSKPPSEKTIAARDRDGVVEISETYQFTSTLYYGIEYHFRSLDTWLRGIHKSFCSEHTWHDDLLENNPNKYSLFYLKENEIQPAEEMISVEDMKNENMEKEVEKTKA